MKKLDCCLQGERHSEGSYDQNMSLSAISSQLLIPLEPNWVWWYIIISQSVLWKKKDYCTQGQGHSEGSKCQCLSRWYLQNCLTFCYQTWYCDALSWARVSCKKIGLLFSKSRSQWRFKTLLNLYVSHIFETTKYYVSKLGIVIHITSRTVEQKKKVICYFQGQGNCNSSYDQYTTISTVSFELLILLLPNLVW